MPYIDEFDNIVTLSKRNQRYYGPTESSKIDSSMTETSADLITIYNKVGEIKDSIAALASGYLLPSGSLNSLWDLKREVYKLERKISNRIYTQATQAQILE